MGRQCLRCGDAIPRFSGFWGVRYILGGQHFRFSSDVLTKNVLGTTKFEGNKNFGGRHARMLPVATGLRYGRMHLCLFCKRQTQHTANVVEPHATLCTYSFFEVATPEWSTMSQNSARPRGLVSAPFYKSSCTRSFTATRYRRPSTKAHDNTTFITVSCLCANNLLICQSHVAPNTCMLLFFLAGCERKYLSINLSIKMSVTKNITTQPLVRNKTSNVPCVLQIFERKTAWCCSGPKARKRQ